MEKIKYDVFIRGKLIDLVSLNEEIVAKSNWYNWFNDEEVTTNTQHHYYPNNRSKQMNFYRSEIENNKTKLQLGVVHKEDNRLIGMVSLNSIDFLNRKCELSTIIGEKKYQNLKYNIEACQLILKHAFGNLNMNKVYAGSLSRGIALCRSRILGFKEEGIKRREIYKNGEYKDIYLYGLLRDEYYRQVKSATKKEAVPCDLSK